MHANKPLAVCAALICLLARGIATADPPRHNSEPVVIFTHAWVSSGDANPPPAWLVIPALLDIQPTLLQVDARRDVSAQLRRFCHAHSIDVAKCAVLLDALNEFVDFDQLCSPQKEKQSEPSFMVVKNLIVAAPSGDTNERQVPRFAWVQDDAQSIAADLCRFAQSQDGAKPIVKLDVQCVLALEAALLRSLNWINSLESCNLIAKQQASVERAPARDENGDPDLTTRVAAVEQSIVALKTKSEKQDDDIEKDSREVGGDSDVRVEELERADRSEVGQSPGVTEALGEYRERPSTTEATSHQSSLSDQAAESAIYANDVGEGEASSSQETRPESDAMKEIPISPSDTTAAAPSLDMGDPDVASSTNDEAQELMEDDTRAEKLLPVDSNTNTELSTSDGDDDGNDDQYDAHVPADQARDLTEADNLKEPDNDGARPSPHENDPFNSGPVPKADETPSLPLEDLPATTEATSSVEYTSPTTKETDESVERMRSPIAVEAIGMLPQVDDEASAPSPEVLEVLSTLAMLFFVFYLVLDLLSIAISNVVDALQARGSQAAQALSPFFSRSESKSTAEVAPLPEHDDIKAILSRSSRPPSPRTWSTLFFASSAPRETRNSLHRRVEAIEKVAKSYLRRLQKAAFGFWRFGTMSIGPNVALVRRESSEDSSATSTTAVEFSESQLSKPAGSPPLRTSFTCVAMALMFARHGVIFHSIDTSKLDEDSKATGSKPDSPESRSLLFDYRRDAAARRIQECWRSRHKKAQNVKLSINTSNPSFHPRTAVSTSAPTTPLFALLAKDLRKRQPQPKASGTPRLAFAIRKVMTPSSSARLPPAS